VRKQRIGREKKNTVPRLGRFMPERKEYTYGRRVKPRKKVQREVDLQTSMGS